MRHKDKGILYKILLKFLMIYINSIQSNVCKDSDYVFCVSKKLEEYLKSRYIINCSVSIIPTCIDVDKSRFDIDERSKIRDEFKIDKKFVVVYCGGAQSYQSPKELLIAFLKISKRIDEAFFLILTNILDRGSYHIEIGLFSIILLIYIYIFFIMYKKNFMKKSSDKRIVIMIICLTLINSYMLLEPVFLYMYSAQSYSLYLLIYLDVELMLIIFLILRRFNYEKKIIISVVSVFSLMNAILGCLQYITDKVLINFKDPRRSELCFRSMFYK
ncbi:hypothetical protein LGK95_17060 [Clostridium algoriphilum]|uniref:hypothetical protein n=1 Tax=Clostridium algoriphilum TaxID=198347 RepID=UPI001CF389A9|nr:hypothetical protein [Clostridium algoriphilum]MCB2295196.1 hypothetical protein [Clostridium algoriphilum]